MPGSLNTMHRELSSAPGEASAAGIETYYMPLPGASPCGEDMIFSADFDAIQEARRFDDPSLDQGDWVTEIKEADWGFVVSRSTSLLRDTTKDLRLAVWLTEGWAMEQGLDGLTQGYRVLTGLCQHCWEGLHPRAEEDDNGYRTGYIGWLVTRSTELLRAVPVADSPAGRYTALDWEIATNLVQAIKRDPENAGELSRGKVTTEQFEVSRRATPPAFYSRLLVDLSGFESAMFALEAELDRRSPNDAPSFRPIKDALESLQMLAERFARESGVGTPRKTVPEAEPQGTTRPVAVPSLVPARQEPSFMEGVPMKGPLQTRAQALAQLREVAEFFRRTEPHSPVAHLADKAAAWGEMTLTDWLRTVVKDDASFARIEEQLGVGIKAEPGKT
jgi:type VI secretion system protein ImpA